MDNNAKRSGSTNRQRAVIGLGLALVLLLSVNIFSNVAFKPFQLDLTESKLFTVSEGTQEILASVDEPIVLRLYFTKALGEGNPEHARHFVRVRELLERYASLSDGKLKLELLDAAPFSKSEDKAMAFGLSGIPFNEAGDLGYFGLVGANSTDDLQFIRYLAPDRDKFLEYDVTKLIHRLIKPKKKVIGLISSLAIGGAGTVPYRDAPRWPAIDQIREFFEVRPLPPYVDEIPDDIDVLMVVHPKKFDDHALYAIDQFVLNGGRALVFVDTLVESTGRSGNTDPTAAGRSEFDRLLNSWGLALVPNRIAGDLDASRRIRIRHEGRIAVIDYVAWLALNPDNFDGSDVTTGEIATLNLGTAGILETVRAPGLTVTPLITTGLKSMAIDGRKFGSQPDVVSMFRNFKPENRKMMLAARTTGIANTAFPGGPPTIKVSPPSTGKKETPSKASAPASAKPHLTRSKGPINAIVVSDVDMLHDEFWADIEDQQGRQVLRPNANNIDFVINALDNLTGSDALIDLRGRANTSRPFHLIQRIRQDAERQFRQKERELQDQLTAARTEMEALTERDIGDARVTLSAEQRAKINDFRRQMVKVRRELRDVQHSLRKDMEQLDGWLKFINIGAIPLLIVAGAFATTAYRRSRRKRPGKRSED